MEDGGAELDLVPAQVAQLGHPQALPEGDQGHGGAVPMPVRLGGLDQRVNLAGREVFAGAQFGVRAPAGSTVRSRLARKLPRFNEEV
jgi:hypothetical protein